MNRHGDWQRPGPGGWVPEDPLEVCRPGDLAPTLPLGRRCGRRWFDAQDDLYLDPPWCCAREAGHLGPHFAISRHGQHIAAVAVEPEVAAEPDRD